MLPFWITPERQVAVMREVKHACPYVSDQTTLHELDDEELFTLCGVFYTQVKGKWCICIPIVKSKPKPAVIIWIKAHSSL